VKPGESGESGGKAADGGIPDPWPGLARKGIGEKRNRRRDDADMDEPGLKAQIEKIVELPLLCVADGPEPLFQHGGPFPVLRHLERLSQPARRPPVNNEGKERPAQPRVKARRRSRIRDAPVTSQRKK